MKNKPFYIMNYVELVFAEEKCVYIHTTHNHLSDFLYFVCIGLFLFLHFFLLLLNENEPDDNRVSFTLFNRYLYSCMCEYVGHKSSLDFSFVFYTLRVVIKATEMLWRHGCMLVSYIIKNVNVIIRFQRKRADRETWNKKKRIFTAGSMPGITHI